ncbi:MAG: Arc family DNA-binding protein [Planctomycetes bacterium]|nr:Arc family DNA-binding protein [Planctomycetota bacterium]
MGKRDSFLLRLPPEILEALRCWADDELRSTNAQIEVLLTKALKDTKRFPKKLSSPKSDGIQKEKESD